MKKMLYGLVITTALIFLYLCPADGFDASLAGLLLWFQTLVPTLLPLMILSNLIINLGLIEPLMFLFAPIFRFLFGVGTNGSYALTVGFFCGYPMGAKVIADLTNEKQITLTEAQYLLGFCNNVSPMFIINFLVLEHLHKEELIIPTIVIIYGAPLLYGLFSGIKCRKQFQESTSLHTNTAPTTTLNFGLVDACIMNGILNITKLGGYIMLFAILAKIVLYLPISNAVIKAFLVGIMEVTNGIHTISMENASFTIQYLLLIAICSFGGLSSIAQTESMIHESGLRLSKYVISKLIITVIALALAACYLL